MLIAYWILAGLLALAYLAAGGMKLAQPREKLVASGMGWAAITHLARSEAKSLPANVVLLLLAAALAWIGFGIWA